MEKKIYLFEGRHVLADLYKVKIDLNNVEYLKKVLLGAIRKSNSIFEKFIVKRYKPRGLTIIAIIKESHFTIHTYPEHHGCNLDIFVCGKEADPTKGLKYIIEKLKPIEVNAMEIYRGNRKDLEMSPIKRTNKMNPLGYTLELDCYDCKRYGRLDDIDSVYNFLEILVKKLEMEKQSPPQLVKTDSKRFPDKTGLSGSINIVQSGIYIHTFTKTKFLWLTIESCKNFDSDIVEDFVTGWFRPDWIDSQWTLRGVDV